MRDPSPPLRLRLLARPRLLRGGLAVHPGSRKAMAILALLALDGGSSREALTAWLWPQADSAAGRRNLRRELFRLRKLGLPLHEDADGLLALGPEVEVDAHRLLRNGTPGDDDGPALDGLDGVGGLELDAWLARWRDRLAEDQARALDRDATACEARGDVQAALALRRRAWSAAPLQESAALPLMRLLAAQGDRAAALQVWRRLSEALRSELDVAPSAYAQAQAASLRVGSGDDAAPPDAIAPSPVPAEGGPVLPATVPFVPRAAAQRAIASAWARGQRVYLQGPPGTGKTRLACEAAAARGAWLRVACEPQDAELPFSSAVRLLRALFATAPQTALPAWVRRELAPLMPELGEAPRAPDAADARARLFAAAAEAWRLLVHDNFNALVLDDWQWGDAASVALWSHLDEAGSLGAGGIVWIVAHRSAQLPPAALARQRADLDAGRAVAVTLEGLDEAEVLALTRRLSGGSGGRLFAQRLHRATDGNPFFLLETLRHLFEQRLLSAGEGGWSTPFDDYTENYAELPVPPSVRATVLARVQALGASVRRLLEAASLGGSEIDVRLLAAPCDLQEEQAVAALEHAAAAQLVHDGATGWRFAHDLVRQSLVQGLSSGRRRLLHGRLAREFEQHAQPPALVAAQWEAAGRPAAAVAWRIAAGAAAVRVHAHDEALSHYRQALADGARGADAARVHLACAEVHQRRADPAAADVAFRAAAAAVDGPDGDQAARWQVQLARAAHLCVTDRIDDGLAALDGMATALQQAGPALRARALAVRGSGLMRQGRYAAAEAAFDEAAALLAPLPEGRRELAALQLERARSANWRGDIDTWGRHARAAVAAHEAIDEPGGLAAALALLCQYHKSLGEREQALAAGTRARALAAACGNVSAHRNVNMHLLQVWMDAGQTGEALALIDEAEALAPGFENQRQAQNYRAARFFVHFLRGEVAAAEAAAERLLAAGAPRGHPVARVGYLHMVADLYIDTGDWARVRALVDEAGALCDAQRAGGNAVWFDDNQAVKEARLAIAEGRPAEALARVDRVSTDEVDIRFQCASIGAAAARALGDAADAARRLDSVGFDEAAPAHALACWLEQRLLLAAAEGRHDAAADARTRAELAAGRVPALLVERLQQALDGPPH